MEDDISWSMTLLGEVIGRRSAVEDVDKFDEMESNAGGMPFEIVLTGSSALFLLGNRTADALLLRSRRPVLACNQKSI